MRIFRFIYYLGYLVVHIVLGSLAVARSALTRGGAGRPCIVELPLRCITDLEISLLASSITITPGTLVLGVAAAQQETPPTLFVHSLYDNDRERVISGLRALESVVLNATRKGGVS